MGRPRLGLHTKILLFQVGLTLGVVALLCGAVLFILSSLVSEQYGARVLGVAQSVAQMPSIRNAFDDPDPSATIQPLAEAVRVATGVAFVVVANRDQVRYSHPNPERIGQVLSTDGQLALDGLAYVTTERGTLGESIRAKVPILDGDGEVIGAVSVGILADVLAEVVSRNWALILGVGVLSLALGAAGSYGLARHIKRQIFNLEPAEIAALVEQREALLHGIREGVVAVDMHGALTLVNDEAARLLNVDPEWLGHAVEGVLPQLGLQEVLVTRRSVSDQTVLANGRAIVVSRMPVETRGMLVGAIATFRDHTEMQALVRELNGTRSYLDALRAQAHEFANKLHTVAGLVELGLYGEAKSYIHDATAHQQELVENLPRRVADSSVLALLVGKASVAAERGIHFSVSAETHVGPLADAGAAVSTVLGNLVENAFDAVAGRPERRVQIHLEDTDEMLTLRVADSGAGLARDALPRLFEDGYSTKSVPGGPHRGLGLALVRRVVEGVGGEVRARNADDGGAEFSVCMPLGTAVPAEPAPDSRVLLPLAS
ncbi:MAG: sensor histidine kinase [Chloroflexi bacterium]|nr:sensor histidine kinase [Chloroflexota bacterium]